MRYVVRRTFAASPVQRDVYRVVVEVLWRHKRWGLLAHVEKLHGVIGPGIPWSRFRESDRRTLRELIEMERTRLCREAQDFAHLAARVLKEIDDDRE